MVALGGRGILDSHEPSCMAHLNFRIQYRSTKLSIDEVAMPWWMLAAAWRTLGSQGLQGGRFFGKKKTWKQTKKSTTLPETNIAPENGWFEDSFPFGIAYFGGYVSSRECICGGFETTCFFDKFQHVCETNTFFWLDNTPKVQNIEYCVNTGQVGWVLASLSILQDISF